jgi:steroid 5-alpha reductase family enzyme
MNYYSTLGVMLWGYMTLWFLISLIKRRNDVADVAWGVGFVLLAWTSFFLSGGSGARGILVGILVSIWGLRLSWHIHARHRGKPEDFRYMTWRREWGKWFYARSYAQVYLLQGALLFLVALPVLMINRRPGGTVRFSWRHGRLRLALWIPFRIGRGCGTCAVRKRST